jgi:DNA-binding PadR family transcriptional regulator
MHIGSEFWRQRARRRFGRGMLKYVLLKLLANEPRHGYDLMRIFGERGWGRLAAGTLYPMLAKLEEMGYVESREESGRRIYRITDAGLQRLRDVAGDLNLEFQGEEEHMQPQPDLRSALVRLSNAVQTAAGTAKAETSAQIVQKIDALRKEIFLLLANE